MRKIALIVSVLIVLTGVLGADLRRDDSPAKSNETKKGCYGYTIIEFGKGINCNGDTVKLVKVNGGQELQKLSDPSRSFELAEN